MADRNRQNQRNRYQGEYRRDQRDEGFRQQSEQFADYGRGQAGDTYGYGDGQFGEAEYSDAGAGMTYGGYGNDRGYAERERGYREDSQRGGQYRQSRDNRQGGNGQRGFPAPQQQERYGFGSDASAYRDDQGSMYRDDRYGDAYSNRNRRDERGFIDKAGDEIASWFGDNDAARRREMDHRGRGPSNYTRSDDRILEDVCDELTEDWRVDARNIQVTVADGEVTLDGTVDSRNAKRRAEDVVHDCSGVNHVQNNLRVQEAENNVNRTDTTQAV